MNKNTIQHAEHSASLEQEFESQTVPLSHRHSTRAVSAVWFGFPMILTNAVFGGIMAYNLGFWRAIVAILLGNLVLFAYVGTLSYLAGKTGLNFAMQARKTFGSRGYIITSAFLSTVVIGWYAFQTGLTGTIINTTFGWNMTGTIVLATVLYTGVTFLGVRALSIIGMIAAPMFVILALAALYFVSQHTNLGQVTDYKGTAGGITMGIAMTMVIAGFADSGTMTADFTRWSKDGRSAVIATFSAFPIANVVSLLSGVVIVSAGAGINPAQNGGDFLHLLIGHNPLLNALALLFVFINLGSVCTHCLYNGAVGYSHLLNSKMRLWTIILGVIGGLLAVVGVWSYFLNWLSLLGVAVPPIGAVMIVDLLFLGHIASTRAETAYRGSAFLAWAIGTLCATAAHLWFPDYGEALIGALVGGSAYAVIHSMRVKKLVTA
ncbi:purine-cytosine permease family protein [Rouxiella chamberiensis]|uniref:Cytosine permease n=1 Tax=Rouxiella chamberiensis TaxID=1513468 RepID=A0ABY7HL65_9GAMM|nr:cytosine permease [Rouxiella chamberiensis]WAT00089.1 cytosine permease [Rouxiella chamberiensis]